MKIAMVSEHASPLAVLGGVDAGGQNVHVAALAGALARRGDDVVVHTRRDDPDLAPRVRICGVCVDHVDAGPPECVPKDELLPYIPAFAEELECHPALVGTGLELAALMTNAHQLAVELRPAQRVRGSGKKVPVDGFSLSVSSGALAGIGEAVLKLTAVLALGRRRRPQHPLEPERSRVVRQGLGRGPGSLVAVLAQPDGIAAAERVVRELARGSSVALEYVENMPMEPLTLLVGQIGVERLAHSIMADAARRVVARPHDHLPLFECRQRSHEGGHVEVRRLREQRQRHGPRQNGHDVEHATRVAVENLLKVLEAR